MRSMPLFTLLAAFALAFSGCFGGGDECPEDDEDCPDPTGTSTGTSTSTNTGTNTTPPQPNQRPQLMVTVTDDNGTVTQVVLPGGNLTFSAAGSTDADGRIENVAVTVSDANRTQGETKQLMRNGQFTPATFGFSTPGRATALVAMVDDNQGFNSTQVPIYVNHPQGPFSYTMDLLAPVGTATDCAGSVGNPIADAQYYRAFAFETKANASFVAATVEAGSAEIAVCDPDGNALSPAGTDTVMTDANATFNASLDGYYVAALSKAPGQAVSVSVVVHYEPRPAA